MPKHESSGPKRVCESLLTWCPLVATFTAITVDSTSANVSVSSATCFFALSNRSASKAGTNVIPACENASATVVTSAVVSVARSCAVGHPHTIRRRNSVDPSVTFSVPVGHQQPLKGSRFHHPKRKQRTRI